MFNLKTCKNEKSNLFNRSDVLDGSYVNQL